MLIDPTADRSSVPDSIIVRGRPVSGFQALPPEQALPLQREILEAANECGCRTGTVIAATALSIYLMASVLWPMLVGQPTSVTWLGALGIVLAGSLVGKFVGVQLANRRLRLGIETLQASIRQQERRPK